MSDYTWPANLKLDPGAKTAIEKVPEKYPLVAEWPEDEKLLVADQPKAIADVLIPQFHSEIQNARIAYLYQQTMGSRHRSTMGETKKLSPKIRMISNYDFLIVLNWTIWRGMNTPRRAALVDHLLEQCGVGDEGQLIKLSHDIKEFNAIVNRWGLWRENVATFIDAAKAQLELPIQTSKP